MVCFSQYPDDPRPRRAVAALTKEGMVVDYICIRGDNQARYEQGGRVVVTRLPIAHRRGGRLSYFVTYSAFILASATILAIRSIRRHYDLVYIHNMPDVLVASALWPKMLGAKVILDLHDPMPELMTTIFGLSENSFSVRSLRWLERWSIARANLVLTVNSACRRMFESRSCDPEKIGVIMNTPDEEIFQVRSPHSYKVRQDHAHLVVMYHGSLVARNGLDLAVAAMVKVRQTVPDAELRVYGRPTPFLHDVMAGVRAQAMEEYVRYLGPRRLEDLPREIESCDVGVIPNHRNAFSDINTPTRIFEYLALGKPVVAPNTPGIRDYFSPETLFLFESGEADDLARQLIFVAVHRDEAVETAERGQAIYQKHRWAEERQKLVGLVKGLLQERTGS